MRTLKDIGCGRTVSCGKTPWRRRSKTPDYGYGNYQRNRDICRRVAPLGDPIEVTVRGYELSLRKADA